MSNLTKPPTFTDVDEERAYLKERLCAAMRIFAAEGFDHGVVSLFGLTLVSFCCGMEGDHSLVESTRAAFACRFEALFVEGWCSLLTTL